MKFTGSKGVISSVAVSTSSSEIMPTNGSRKYGIIWNASGQEVLVAFGDTATTSEGGYTVKVADGAAYELPATYRGSVSGITASGTGNVSVTVIE
jgi:hypothetical protein